MEKDIRKDLKNSPSDYSYILSKAGLGSIPIFGSAISELFGMVIAEPLSKRRDEWLIQLYKSLEELQLRVHDFDIKNLKDNRQFQTVVLNAIQMIIKNHSLEKKQFLLNACLNTAITTSINEDEQLMFLNYIDELSVWHLKLLYYFMNPVERLKEKAIHKNSYYMGSPAQPLLDYYPELKGRTDFIRIIVKDLYSKSLFNVENLNITMTANGMVESRLTEFGNKFMEYIGGTGV